MKSIRISCAAAFTLALAGCGGGGVVVDITDAPPDLATIDHVYISLGSVDVHVVDKEDKESGDKEDPNKWQTVEPRAGRIDLMALQNDVTQTLGELDLPGGKITQIRLFIDEEAENEVIQKDGQVCALDLSSVDKTGLKINHPFKAIDVEERVRVVVDFDLKESIDQEGDCSYALKPVIKLKTTEPAE